MHSDKLTKIAVVGLGRMGDPIARHLRSKNPSVEFSVFDVAPGIAENWVQENGGKTSDLLPDVVRNAQLIVSSLPADKELIAVASAVIPQLLSGAIWVDHSTTSAQIAREVAGQVAAANAIFLDAPVSGGVDGARNGSLTVMVGGSESGFNSVKEVMTAYAARTTYMGESGAGQVTKMTNQICVLGLCQALAEGLSFAQRAGLDTKQVVQVMLQGSSASWQMQNRAGQMLDGEYDFGFSTTLMRKDVGLVLEEARAMDTSLPVTELVAGMLDELDQMGGAQWDWCSLMERQRQQR